MNEEGDRIDALGRLVALQMAVIDALAEALLTANSRTFAIQELLKAKGVLTGDEIEAKASAIGEDADLAVELGDKYVEFRRVRREIQELSDEDEDDDT